SRNRLFFFQAEDGIRDFHVTGVQTCALPIFFTSCNRIFSACNIIPASYNRIIFPYIGIPRPHIRALWSYMPPKRPYNRIFTCCRSEERRVGKERVSRW